jgi:hypothetical protein
MTRALHNAGDPPDAFYGIQEPAEQHQGQQGRRLEHAENNSIVIRQLLGWRYDAKEEQEKEKKKACILPVVLPDQRFPQNGTGMVHAIVDVSMV